MTLKAWKKISNKQKTHQFTDMVLTELMSAGVVTFESREAAEEALDILDDLFAEYKEYLITELEKKEQYMLDQKELPPELFSDAVKYLTAFIKGEDA